MKQIVAFGCGAAILLSMGCLRDGEWSIRKTLGWDENPNNFDMKKMPPASLAVAERVENLGRKILAQNTFTGIDPLFFTIGAKESMLFHRGTEQLYISEGLVEKCKTDAELAAVLCSELGQMVAETRAAKNAGRHIDPIPDASHGAPLFPGGNAFDAGRQADLAYHEKRYPRGNASEIVDSIKTTRELLKGAGFDPAEYERVEPLLKQSTRGEQLRKQMGGSAPAPNWQK